MRIKINTAAVAESATRISTTNASILNEFDSVGTALATLRQHWQGDASEQAANAFSNISKTFPDSRYQVVESLVKFMRVQVGERYEKIEGSLQSAASEFK